MVLNQKQKQKLDALKPEDVSEKRRDEMLLVFKVLQGNEAEENFQFEYDEIFDEDETVCELSLEEFKKTAPKIYEYIGNIKGNKIYNTIKSGKTTTGISLKTNVENAVQKLKDNKRISSIKKEKAIAKKWELYEESKVLKEKGVTLNRNLSWKIWRIEERKRVLEYIDEDKLDKNLEIVEYLGEKFIQDLKKIKFGDDDDD